MLDSKEHIMLLGVQVREFQYKQGVTKFVYSFERYHFWRDKRYSQRFDINLAGTTALIKTRKDTYCDTLVIRLHVALSNYCNKIHTPLSTITPELMTTAREKTKELLQLI